MAAITESIARKDKIETFEKRIRVCKIVFTILWAVFVFLPFTNAILKILNIMNNPWWFTMITYISLAISIPAFIFLLKKEYKWFVIFGFIMLYPATVSSAEMCQALPGLLSLLLTNSTIMISFILYLVFGIVLLVNLSNYKKFKKKG